MYGSVEDAMRAIDLAVEDTLADSPELKEHEDDVYHDIAQSMMYECAPAIRRELSRRTGVSIPVGMNDR